MFGNIALCSKRAEIVEEKVAAVFERQRPLYISFGFPITRHCQHDSNPLPLVYNLLFVLLYCLSSRRMQKKSFHITYFKTTRLISEINRP